jgi:hypothetical protein
VSLLVISGAIRLGDEARPHVDPDVLVAHFGRRQAKCPLTTRSTTDSSPKMVADGPVVKESDLRALTSRTLVMQPTMQGCRLNTSSRSTGFTRHNGFETVPFGSETGSLPLSPEAVA